MFGPPKGLGQQSIYKEPPNQYSEKSRRSKGYPSEESLIATGQIQDTDHPLSVDNYYGVMSAPPIPYIDDEHPRILAEQNRILWPHEDSYSLGAMGQWYKDPSGSLLEWLTPKNAWGFVIGGGALYALGNTRFKGTAAQGVLSGIGGIVLGLGMLPIIINATKEKK